ncbi:hypothetical protein ONZ43_g3226 [Nemania bipapillata]|uniref:Uncharacterized protein n=1 Tax=Nemania bipapillata TaxID=110536 RepID=A0ACC2IXL7_9PEZI|nr:hypothetical protein ONZ43_g3226 [Nemania bipapillata]
MEPVSEDDYEALADGHEEAMRKHRAGDPAKALRFADRALDVYSQGLAKFPRSFLLAYNKARLELFKATDPILSSAPGISHRDVRNLLECALSSHYYARDLDPTDTHTLFNLAVVLTGIAENIGEDDEADDIEAIEIAIQALKVQSHCFDLQQGMLETARNHIEQDDDGQAATKSVPESQSIRREEQLVSIKELVTADTLLETIISQIGTLTTLYSILISSLVSSPGLPGTSSNNLAWIESYCTNLLLQVLPKLLDENQNIPEHRILEARLSQAVLVSHYLELSFRLCKVDGEQYQRELDVAFKHPGLDAASEAVLMASVDARLAFHSALADFVSRGAADTAIESYGSLQWKILVEAQSLLSSAAKRPNADTRVVAKTHQRRGDISLSLQMLAYPPTAHAQARTTTPQLLQYAEVYYRNAAKLFASLGPSEDEERAVSELKGVVVGILQQTAADQATSGSSSGQDNTDAFMGMSASPDQIRRALEPAVKAKGAQWVKECIEDMANESVIRQEICSAITQV